MTRTKFAWDKSPTNYHDWSTGSSAKGVPVKGPKFRHVRLSCHAPSTGHRFIFYWPSGAWWNIDVYFDRRKAAGKEKP